MFLAAQDATTWPDAFVAVGVVVAFCAFCAFIVWQAGR